MPRGVYERTFETRSVLSAAHKGRKHTEETKQKIGLLVKGRKHSLETKLKIGISSFIHGHSGNGKSITYTSWRSMIQRCNNSKHADYYKYGGRGIKVCERWEKFENFLEDMGERPEGLTIDRIDNSRDYILENCRWATRSQQQKNKGGKK